MDMHARSVAAAPSLLTQRVLDTFQSAAFSRARNEADLQAIGHLRHDCYLREGAIEPFEEGRMEDAYDQLPNTYNISISIGGQIVSAIRVHVLTVQNPHSPSAQAFPDIISPLLDQGLTLIDPTRFVVCAQASRQFPALAYVALKVPFAAAQNFNADIALASVRREHVAFYTKYLRYKMRSEFREYHQLTKPLALMTSQFRDEAPKVGDKYPFFRMKNDDLFDLFVA